MSKITSRTEVLISDGKLLDEEFSFAILKKSDNKIMVILKGLDLIIIHENRKIQNCCSFSSNDFAYNKFLYIVGKMCKKENISSYFIEDHDFNKEKLNELQDLDLLFKIFKDNINQ